MEEKSDQPQRQTFEQESLETGHTDPEGRLNNFLRDQPDKVGPRTRSESARQRRLQDDLDHQQALLQQQQQQHQQQKQQPSPPNRLPPQPPNDNSAQTDINTAILNTLSDMRAQQAAQQAESQHQLNTVLGELQTTRNLFAQQQQTIQQYKDEIQGLKQLFRTTRSQLGSPSSSSLNNQPPQLSTPDPTSTQFGLQQPPSDSLHLDQMQQTMMAMGLQSQLPPPPGLSHPSQLHHSNPQMPNINFQTQSAQPNTSSPFVGSTTSTNSLSPPNTNPPPAHSQSQSTFQHSTGLPAASAPPANFNNTAHATGQQSTSFPQYFTPD